MAIPLFEIKWSKVPIVILKGGDRQLTFYKVKKFGSKYFAIKDPHGGGMVFELDDRYEYRYKKSSLYIYNFSNFKPVSLTGLAEIDKKLRKDGKSQLENVDALLSQLSDEQITNLGDKIKDPASGFSPETKRFLQDYSIDDENSKTEMLIALHHQKGPITKYSSQLIGMGINSGNYAIIQIGHKKLDIVPMAIHDNRAYTEYGIFNFTIDNLYLVKKQVVGFFILNDSEDMIAQSIPKDANRKLKQMIRKKKWSWLETFQKPKRTKMSTPKFAYRVKIDKVEIKEDEEAKAKINAELRPKPIIKKIKQTPENDDDINMKLLNRIAESEEMEQEQELPALPQPEIEPITEEPIIEEPQIEEPITEEPIQNDTIEPEPVEAEVEPESIELELSEAIGPPKG